MSDQPRRFYQIRAVITKKLEYGQSCFDDNEFMKMVNENLKEVNADDVKINCFDKTFEYTHSTRCECIIFQQIDLDKLTK